MPAGPALGVAQKVERLGFAGGLRSQLALQVQGAAVEGDGFRQASATDGNLAQVAQDLSGFQAFRSLVLKDRQRLPEKPFRRGKVAAAVDLEAV